MQAQKILQVSIDTDDSIAALKFVIPNLEEGFTIDADGGVIGVTGDDAKAIMELLTKRLRGRTEQKSGKVHNTRENDTRYPYTYSCDLIRGIAGSRDDGMKLSRADASLIRSELAAAAGVDDAEIACTLADRYLAQNAI